MQAARIPIGSSWRADAKFTAKSILIAAEMRSEASLPPCLVANGQLPGLLVLERKRSQETECSVGVEPAKSTVAARAHRLKGTKIV